MCHFTVSMYRTIVCYYLASLARWHLLRIKLLGKLLKLDSNGLHSADLGKTEFEVVQLSWNGNFLTLCIWPIN